jgi:putative endonuclease
MVNDRTLTTSGHLALGRSGEDLAERYLRRKGYRILGRNIRTPYGELDLVARRRGCIVFVEVKTRREGEDCFPPSLAVTPRKLWRLRRAACAWLEREFGTGGNCPPARLDVIGISQEEVREHYEDVTAM